MTTGLVSQFQNASWDEAQLSILIEMEYLIEQAFGDKNSLTNLGEMLNRMGDYAISGRVTMRLGQLVEEVDAAIDGTGMKSAQRKAVTECKSVSDIFYWLQAAGIAFAVGYQINDYFRLTERLSDAIDAVRESLMYLRHGSSLADLERSIEILERAGIQVPIEIQGIATDPREGNDSAVPATNIAMARAWLDSALQHLREAQAQAQIGEREERSDQRPTDTKMTGAHNLYR